MTDMTLIHRTGEGSQRRRRLPQQRRGRGRPSRPLLADRQGHHPPGHQGEQVSAGREIRGRK